MAVRPVRIKAKARPPRSKRPLLVEIAVRLPIVGRAAIVVPLRLPQGPLRRAVGEWGLREVGLGSVARRDYEVIRTFASPGFEVVPARELAVLLGYEAPALNGADAGVKFLHDWFEAWDDFTFVSGKGSTWATAAFCC